MVVINHLNISPGIGFWNCGHQSAQSFLKSSSWSKIRVETKAGKKGYRVVCIVARIILPGLKISILNFK